MRMSQDDFITLDKIQDGSITQNKAGDLFIGGEKVWYVPQEPKITIGKYELKVETLEKLIEFAESGKLDEIMKQGT